MGSVSFCGSTENLHYDHELPYSKGGTSLTSANVRRLRIEPKAEKHNPPSLKITADKP